MNEGSLAAVAHTAPVVAKPVKVDKRWWSTLEQRAYLDAKQPAYLEAKAVAGGVTLFFRVIDTEFLTLWSPYSLAVQFNAKGIGRAWNTACPSLLQDLKTTALTDIPDAELDSSGPKDSTLTRIRKV